MPDEVYALVESVPCPTCGAAVGVACVPTSHGQSCLVMTGATVTSPHLARWTAAREAGVKVRDG